MSRALYVLKTEEDRDRALRAVCALPVNSRVECKLVKRTLPQNDRMWAMCTDFAEQITYHGELRTPESWKLLFLDDLKREYEVVPSLDGSGFVRLDGHSSSDLSTEEMSALIELIFKWGARLGVRWSDPQERAREAAFGQRVVG